MCHKIFSEQEILREELKQYMSVKDKLKQRVAELEEELKKIKEAAEKSKSGKSDDEVFFKFDIRSMIIYMIPARLQPSRQLVTFKRL